MEELAPQARLGSPVRRIAGDGQADRGEVNANLVRPAGLQSHAQQGVLGQELDHFEVGDRFLRRLRVERHSRRVAAVAADGSFDPSLPRPRPAADERQVLPLEGMPADECRESRVGLLGAGDDEQTRRISIQTVDDSRPLGVTACDAATQKRVDQRACRVSGSGMDDETGGLVDDEQMIVLVGDPKLDHLLFQGCVGEAARVDDHLFPAREPVALGENHAVHEHRTPVDQPLGGRARAELRERGQEAVEPLARRALRDATGLGGHAAGAVYGPRRTGRRAGLRPRSR